MKRTEKNKKYHFSSMAAVNKTPVFKSDDYGKWEDLSGESVYDDMFEAGEENAFEEFGYDDYGSVYYKKNGGRLKADKDDEENMEGDII